MTRQCDLPDSKAAVFRSLHHAALVCATGVLFVLLTPEHRLNQEEVEADDGEQKLQPQEYSPRMTAAASAGAFEVEGR